MDVLAHELGHAILKLNDKGHVWQASNLMSSGTLNNGGNLISISQFRSARENIIKNHPGLLSRLDKPWLTIHSAPLIINEIELIR